MEKPLILVTNDDGITAPGIRALIDVMSRIGDVWVVAPDKPQSGMGHAITINSTLTLNQMEAQNGAIKEFACSGTPADCVKMAKDKMLPRKPDLCVSGINHGSNASINVIYSGTMSAAIEAAVEGIPSIGFSLLDHNWNANFECIKPIVEKIARTALKEGIPANTVLNVNIPNCEEIKGIKICRQANAKWCEVFEKRTSPQGHEYYWLTGEFVNLEQGADDTDDKALKENYVSIVPVTYDLTHHKHIETLKNWKL